MKQNPQWLLTIFVGIFLVSGCCTYRHFQEWDYKVINSNAMPVNSPETPAALLNEQGKEGWILIQNEGGWFYLKRAKR